MTDITGKVYSAKGRLFVLSENISAGKHKNGGTEEESLNVFEEMLQEEEFEDEKVKEHQKVPRIKSKSLLEENAALIPKSEEKPAKQRTWRQEGSLCELVISLNLVLNIYVLQIFLYDDAISGESVVPNLVPPVSSIPLALPSESVPPIQSAKLVPNISKVPTLKYSFYIDYDLNFRYRKATELAIPLLNSSALQGKIAAESFVYHWKYAIDPEAEYELIVWLSCGSILK